MRKTVILNECKYLRLNLSVISSYLHKRIDFKMSNEVTIFHNPKCSKSRATLKLLKDHKITPLIIEYLIVTLDKDIIEDILKKLNKEPRDIMRKTEQAFKNNDLKNKNLTRTQLIEAIIRDPILMERPIVLCNNKAAIGRPPESILKII